MPRPIRPILAVFTALATALGLVPLAGVASADEHTFNRGIATACTAYAQDPPTERFADIDGRTHEEAINCLAHWEIVRGQDIDGERVYDPAGTVSREALATFIARSADYLGFRGHWPMPFAIELDPTTADNPHNVRNRVQTQVVNQFTLGYFSAEVRFEVYRDGELAHMTQQLSGLGGDTLLSYNAGADEGDVDTIVACIVHPDDEPTATEEYCVDRDDGDLVPREDRRGESVETSWTAAASPGPAPSGEWSNEVLTIDTGDNAFHGHVLPAADPDEPLYLFVYSETDTFQVGDHGEVTMTQWECAVTATSEGHDIRHVLRASYNVDPADDSIFDLSTPVDVDHCF